MTIAQHQVGPRPKNELTPLARKSLLLIATLSILLLALFLRTSNLPSESLDGDELFSRRVAVAETSAAWTIVRQDLVHPPLYYFLLKATIPGGDQSTAYEVRRLSLAAGLASVLIVILLGLAASELRAPAVMAALFLALNKVHIFYSQQARSYALYAALVALLLLWRLLAARHSQRVAYWVCGVLLMVAITWTHYVGFLFCAACVLPMALSDPANRGGKTSRLLPIASLAATFLLFLPWLIPQLAVYRQKSGLSKNLEWQALPGVYELKMAFADYVGILDFPGATTVSCLIMVSLLCCVFVPRVGTEPAGLAESADMELSLASMAVAPPVILWLMSQSPLQLPIFGERHLLPAIIPVLVLVSYGLQRVSKLARRSLHRGVLMSIGTLVLCGFQAAPVFRDWPGPVRQPYSVVAEDLLTVPEFQLPAYTTWPYGIGEPVNFYLKRGKRAVQDLPDANGLATLPARAVLLYRPAAPGEDSRVRRLLREYSIVNRKYYVAVNSTFGTQLIVLQRHP